MSTRDSWPPLSAPLHQPGAWASVSGCVHSVWSGSQDSWALNKHSVPVPTAQMGHSQAQGLRSAWCHLENPPLPFQHSGHSDSGFWENGTMGGNVKYAASHLSERPVIPAAWAGQAAVTVTGKLRAGEAASCCFHSPLYQPA